MFGDLIRLGSELYRAIKAEKIRRDQARLAAEIAKLGPAVERIQAMIESYRRRGMWPEDR